MGEVIISMVDYLYGVINNLPEAITKTYTTPTDSHLFGVKYECSKMDE